MGTNFPYGANKGIYFLSFCVGVPIWVIITNMGDIFPIWEFYFIIMSNVSVDILSFVNDNIYICTQHDIYI